MITSSNVTLPCPSCYCHGGQAAPWRSTPASTWATLTLSFVGGDSTGVSLNRLSRFSHSKLRANPDMIQAGSIRSQPCYELFCSWSSLPYLSQISNSITTIITPHYPPSSPWGTHSISRGPRSKYPCCKAYIGHNNNSINRRCAQQNLAPITAYNAPQLDRQVRQHHAGIHHAGFCRAFCSSLRRLTAGSLPMNRPRSTNFRSFDVALV